MCLFVPAHVYNNLLEKGTLEQQSLAQVALAELKGFCYNPQEILQKYLNQLCEMEVEEEVVNREIYDAQNKTSLPGILVRKEGEKSNKDVAVDEAYDGAGTTYEFFQKFFGRNSLDNKGMKLISTVHYGRNFGNAFWNGKTMTYGDGDGVIFNRFTAIIDVIAHEMSHGVTQFTAGLVYRDQPGALNEHFSDVFGAMVKQYKLNQTADQADWLIGEGLFTKQVNGRALRDMRNPGTAYDDKRVGKDPQPNHMDRYVKTEQDNGGVHINSSIPNKAFYHTAVNIGGFSYERAGKIWYKALITKMQPRSQFQDMVNATVEVAVNLYGKNSTEHKAVVDGWGQVGLAATNKL